MWWSIAGPIIGALIGASVALFIHFRSQPRRQGLAYKVLKELGRKTDPARGEFYHAKTSNDNYEIAQHLYQSEAVEVIATAFHEDPAKYGDNDLVRTYHGRDFTRITCENVCGGSSKATAEINLQKAHAGGRLVGRELGRPGTGDGERVAIRTCGDPHPGEAYRNAPGAESSPTPQACLP